MSLAKLFPWNELNSEGRKGLAGMLGLIMALFVAGMALPGKTLFERCVPFGCMYFLIVAVMTVALSRMREDPFARCAWKMLALISIGMFAVLLYGFASHFQWL